MSLDESLVAIPLAGGLFTLGYCTGAWLQYLVGRLMGPLALSWLPRAYRIKLESLTAKHGSVIVLWTRPLVVGNYVSLPAGMTGMPLWRFTLYTFLGIGPWALAMAAVGWFLGEQALGTVSALVPWFLPAVALLWMAYATFRAVRRRGETDRMPIAQ